MDQTLLDRIFPQTRGSGTDYSQIFEKQLMSALGAFSRADLVKKLTDNYFVLMKHTARDLGLDLEAELSGAHVYIIPSPDYSVQSFLFSGQPMVTIAQGLFSLISFRMETMAISEYSREVWEVCPAEQRDAFTEQLQLFEGIYLGLLYAYFEKPFQLPALTSTFPMEVVKWTMAKVFEIELFVLLHELAHIKLGHVKSSQFSWGSSSGPDMSQSLKVEETAADINALEVAMSVSKRCGDEIAWGAVWFLMIHGFHEVFMHRDNPTHPQAVERLEAIMRLTGFPAEVAAVGTWICQHLLAEKEKSEKWRHVPRTKRIEALLRGGSPENACKMLVSFSYHLGSSMGTR